MCRSDHVQARFCHERIGGETRDAFLVGARPRAARAARGQQLRLTAIRQRVHQAVDPAEAECLLDDLLIGEPELERRSTARPGPAGKPGAIGIGVVFEQPGPPLRAPPRVEQRSLAISIAHAENARLPALAGQFWDRCLVERRVDRELRLEGRAVRGALDGGVGCVAVVPRPFLRNEEDLEPAVLFGRLWRRHHLCRGAANDPVGAIAAATGLQTVRAGAALRAVFSFKAVDAGRWQGILRWVLKRTPNRALAAPRRSYRSALNVSQSFPSPLSSPTRNHRCRWSDDPWVQVSRFTCP